MMRIIFILIFLGLYNSSFCQEPDSTTKVNDILFQYGIIDYGAEYYVVDEKNSFLEHHVLYQPYLTDVNVFNIEFGISQSFLEKGNYVSPADLSLSYQHNFKFRNYGSAGFQGVGASMRFIIPTGKDEYYSGFDSWSIEPLLGAQWLFNNPNWFTSFQIRYNYSFASLPDAEPRYSFIRMEYFIGYESSRMWLFLQPDYRYIPSRTSHNFFITINGAYKINGRVGIKAKIKPRIAGDDFFESLSVVGCYVYL